MTTDFTAYVKEQHHVPRSVIAFVETTLFETLGNVEADQALKSILEVRASRITGLRTGKSLRARNRSEDPAEKELFTKNMSSEVRFTIYEAYGRRFEPIIAELMELHCAHPTQHPVKAMFVEPDGTGTRVVAVWRGTMTPLSSGETDAYRDVTLTQPEAILEIPFAVNLRYNDPTDRTVAQQHLDTLNATGLDAPRSDVDDTHNAMMDRAMEQLAATAASQPNAAMPRQVIRIDVVTHTDCLDGIAAAWVVKSFYEGKNRPDLSSPHFDVHVHFADYHQALPELPPKANVFMTDFCPNNIEELKDLLRQCLSLTILDHHPKTRAIIDQLKQWAMDEGIIDRFDAEFSDVKSGALIAWDYLMSANAPPIIRAVSDRDLWKFELPDTELLCESLMAYGMTLEGFDECMKSIPREEHLQRGKVLVQSKAMQVDWLIQNTLCVLNTDIQASSLTWAPTLASVPLTLLAVNGSKPIASLVCEAMEKRYPGYVGYACYWDVDGGTHRCYSIRSQQGNARAIAKHYGGEGHDKAAGFTLLQSGALQVNDKTNEFSMPS